MAVTRVLMIAHGATGATRAARFPQDEPLEPGAERAARQLAVALPLNPGRATALTGPEMRCRQTAQLLQLSQPATDQALADWQAGDWTGRTLDELAAQQPGGVQEWLENPHARPHHGENLTEVISRAGRWLDERDQDRVIAVTHPALLRAVAVHALQAPPSSFWRIDVPPLSTLLASGEPGRWSVRLH